ncbi:cilia- and flagella-associated protein 157-like [Centruroides sculpturatus]|uniref:cilia- and flagella-associated protein 157-like n=1 Tax=Centruroides sculpturatus TaxID=218467 RepID=UPI000C6D41D0|nr:cilia- and flagella-associated protein 157-like [Centruroides sculpturatus]
MFSAGKLASLEKFESEKENLYKEHEKLKSTYKQEVENYEEKILNLQQQYALDHKRLKKEYEEKQEAEKEYYFSDEQTEYAIKTAFSQIKKLKKELYDNTEMTMKLTKENEVLKHKNSILKQKLSISETTESKLASKIDAQQKAIILLKNKCVQQKDLLEKLKNIEKCYEGLLKQEETSKLQIKELTVNVTSMSTNITDINKQLEFYKNEIKMQEEANVKLIIIILKAAKAIKEATMHTPKNEEEKELLIQKRYDLLHSLHTLLESSHEFYNDYYFDFLHSHGVPAEEIQKWFEEKDIPPKYKLGNLGIIPKVEKSKFKQDKENDLTLSQRKFDELQLREKAILSSVNLLTAYENLVKKLSEEKEYFSYGKY